MTHKFINDEKLALELSLVDVLTVSSLFLIIVVFMTCQFRVQLKPYQFGQRYDQSDCFHISCWILVYCDPLSCNQWSTISEITKIVSLTDSLLSNQWNTISEMTKISISD